MTESNASRCYGCHIQHHLKVWETMWKWCYRTAKQINFFWLQQLHLSGDPWPRESMLFAGHTQHARTTQEATSFFWTSSSPKRKFSNPYTGTQCHNIWIMFLGSVLAWSSSFLIYPDIPPTLQKWSADTLIRT